MLLWQYKIAETLEIYFCYNLIPEKVYTYREFDRVLPQLIYDLKANNFTLQVQKTFKIIFNHLFFKYL